MISTDLAVDADVDELADDRHELRCDRRLLLGEFVGVDEAVTGGVDVAEFAERNRCADDHPTVVDGHHGAAVGRVVCRRRRRTGEDRQDDRHEGDERSEPSVCTLRVSHRDHPPCGGGPTGRMPTPPSPFGSATFGLSGLERVATAVAPIRQIGRFGES